MSERPSIRDLAKLAGVSRTTVSLALRDSHKVTAATRERIQELARLHHYQSNPMVAALMQQVASRRRIHNQETIAVITNESTPDSWMLHPWVVQMVKGAKEESHRLGFRLEVFWAGNRGENLKRLAKVLHQRGIRGLLFSPIPHPHPPLDIPWDRFMAVSCSISTGLHTIPCVAFHQSRGARILLEALYQRGVRSAGLVITEEEDERLEYNWSSGAWSFQQKQKDFATHILRLRSFYDFNRFRPWFKRIKPEVIIAPASYVPVAAWLKEISPKVADTVGYALLDVDPDKLGLIAGLHQNSSCIGQEAIRIISQSLYNHTPGLPRQATTVLIDPVFSDGLSLGRFTSAKK